MTHNKNRHSEVDKEKNEVVNDGTRILLDALANVSSSSTDTKQQVITGVADIRDILQQQFQRQSELINSGVSEMKSLIQSQASLIKILHGEVDALKLLNEKLQVEVNECRQLLICPPPQDQSVVKGLHDVQAQLASLLSSMETKRALKAMNSFNYSIHKYVTESLSKFKDPRLEKAIHSMLETSPI